MKSYDLDSEQKERQQNLLCRENEREGIYHNTFQCSRLKDIPANGDQVLSMYSLDMVVMNRLHESTLLARKKSAPAPRLTSSCKFCVFVLFYSL